MGIQKRVYRDRSPSPSTSSLSKRRHSSSSSPKPTSHHGDHHPPPKRRPLKRPTFESYLEFPNLPSNIRVLCEVIAKTPPLQVESVVEETGIRVTQHIVEEVLKLSYGFPASAVKFFRWSGRQLNDKHSPYAWNLVVDMLGKNSFFDAMWDAIKSMKKEGLLSLATFASVFRSYVTADRVQEAIMTFEVMDQYGFPPDVVALNSLMSAICWDGKVLDAFDFVQIAKGRIRPDVDTYAILLEGWEIEGDVVYARKTFSEMVSEIGWDLSNVPAYDSFLCTLIKGSDGLNEAMKFFEKMSDRGCYPGIKFFRIALDECVKCRDARRAGLLWDVIVGRLGAKPDIQMYNSMITLHCYNGDIDLARKMLDDMVYKGVFPDSRTYNVLFEFLIKSRKLKEASIVFIEMVKNEYIPDQYSCGEAVRIYVDNGEPNMATRVWKCMVENYHSNLEETANILVAGLHDLNRLPEAAKYAEDIIHRRIKLSSSTLLKLKHGFSKEGKRFVYEELLRKWKSHQVGDNL